MTADGTEGGELLEGGVDPAAVDVATKSAPDVIFGQSVGGCIDRLANTVGDGVAGRSP